jgi:hypothetical protein
MKPWYAMSSLSILILELPDLRLTLKSPQTNVGTESDGTDDKSLSKFSNSNSLGVFSATIDDTNLIFGHKLHIRTPFCGKRFLTRQIPTSCLPT